ncbi:hypothetical protein P691DRAFT_760825 [Macrolepiota fuliginosa MF-IS2]|uniref:Uncharacterized protein n=1 Tax=Macrolepiota fuliginosa MF-IS2 TaxID=1400762 RepID=A0A9P6C0I4_9AGAR|nr:hypothetical protein P691DRAFT_760825 [Macrolepiota fuliginosa MF-IS2]
MVVTPSPHQYRFSVSRFEAYPGQYQAYTDPARDIRQGEILSYHQPSIPSTLRADMTGEEEQTTDSQAVRGLLHPLGFIFLRNKLARRFFYSGVKTSASRDVGRAGDKGSDIVQDNGPSSPRRSPGASIPEISKRFGEILAGRERPSPRAKYSPNRRVEEIARCNVKVEDIPESREAQDASLVDGFGSESKESRRPSVLLMFGEVAGVVGDLPKGDLKISKLDIGAREQRLGVIRRRKMSMRMRMSSA